MSVGYLTDDDRVREIATVITFFPSSARNVTLPAFVVVVVVVVVVLLWGARAYQTVINSTLFEFYSPGSAQVKSENLT